ncbi:imelysin family protein [Pseudomonas sp. UBA2684]|uniref:imelysin family protein n=1 Tax=Pseudomonas sp. UBA2684 TaxID=1947311 RepID=UPI000E9ED3F8|nr:imelysin family protein [Pseudomonas sp. UBA2684]HBX57525.1 imelysin [Pseudomonas sp.]|tara:strand:+ start:4673 stop:5734 length:1062 start_codon:yes stop_codon:yes gene_type:complete
MIRSSFTLALLGLALSACTPTDPQQQVSAALADGVLLPAYSTWAEADRQLAGSGQAFCAGTQDLSEARQAFLAAQSAWAGLQPLLLGPLAEGNRAWQVQFWPDKKNLVARQVEALIKSKPALTPADLDKSSVVVQGLTAYEYLLFDPAIDLNDATQKARYCPLLSAIGQHQQVLAADVLTQWQAKDGMAAQLQSFPNARYAEPAEAVAELLRTQVSAIDGLKKKLGTPLGRQSKGQPQPYQAEAWRSKASLANLAASLASAERIWHGAEQDGVQALLGSDQTDLKQRLDAAYSDTRQRLAALERPLGELLGDAAGREELNALYDSLNALHRLHEAELAKTLGIQLGFNAHDGD